MPGTVVISITCASLNPLNNPLSAMSWFLWNRGGMDIREVKYLPKFAQRSPGAAECEPRLSGCRKAPLAVTISCGLSPYNSAHHHTSQQPLTTLEDEQSTLGLTGCDELGGRTLTGRAAGLSPGRGSPAGLEKGRKQKDVHSWSRKFKKDFIWANVLNVWHEGNRRKCREKLISKLQSRQV